jgi:N-acetylmuramoyl-L-alanine amidase
MSARVSSLSLIRWVLLSAAIWMTGCAGAVKDTSKSFTKVVIDAGHGGHDSGAKSRYAGQEKDLALDVAMRLQPKLQAAGLDTMMTRSTDKFISLDGRARMSNRQHNVIFVSVHFNYSPRSSARERFLAGSKPRTSAC